MRAKRFVQRLKASYPRDSFAIPLSGVHNGNARVPGEYEDIPLPADHRTQMKQLFMPLFERPDARRADEDEALAEEDVADHRPDRLRGVRPADEVVNQGDLLREILQPRMPMRLVTLVRLFAANRKRLPFLVAKRFTKAGYKRLRRDYD
jgi:hypothetical protein